MSGLTLLSLALIGVASFALSYVGAAVGLVLGHLRVPLLCYVLGDPVAGAATSLAVSTFATLTGTVAHVRGGRVDTRLMISIGVPSALAAYASARYAVFVDAALIKTLIALALVLNGLEMLHQSRRMQANPGHSIRPLQSRKLEVGAQVGLGLFLGAIAGLVGLLLGSLRLPAMVRVARVPPARAIGTNMAIGAVTGISAGVSAMAGGQINLPAFALVCPLTMLGAHLGAHKAGQLDQRALVRWMALVILPTGLGMLVEAALASLH